MLSLVANYTDSDSDSDSNSEASVSVSVVPPTVGPGPGPGSLLPSISISSLSTNQIKKPPLLLVDEQVGDCQNLISKSVVQLKPTQEPAFNLHREQNEDDVVVQGQQTNERTAIIGTDHIEIEDEDDEFVYNRNQIVQPFSAFQRDEDEAEDDEDDDDEDSDDDSSFSQSKPKTQQLLSNPFRNFDTGEAVVKGASVFQIPFLEQEVKRSAALERHVKMTETAGSQEMINGKKICWNYRKGKCRFGHNCTFAHDSDIQQLNEKDSSGKTKAITPVLSNSSGGGSCSGSSNSGGCGSIPGHGHPDQTLDSSMLSVNKEGNSVSTDYDEGIVASSAHLSTSKSSLSCSSSSSAMSSGSSSSLNNVSNLDLSPERGDPNTSNSTWKHRGKGKKRPGLSQTINPSKKVMKTYYQNQTQP